MYVYYTYIFSLQSSYNNFFDLWQCQTCDRCQRFEKIKTQAPEMKAIKVNEPLELVGMDLIGMHTIQIITLP